MTHNHSKEAQIAWHTRLRYGDVTAFSELCQVAIPYLENTFRSRYPASDNQTWFDFVIDTLLKYQQNPALYNSEKGTLFSYLYMDAEGDYLNFRAKERRQPFLVSLSTPEVTRLTAPENDAEEESLDLEVHTLDLVDMFQRLNADATDGMLLCLLVSGERETSIFAEILEITHLSIDEQRRTVKREKDRLRQWLRTTGRKRLNDERG